MNMLLVPNIMHKELSQTLRLVSSQDWFHHYATSLTPYVGDLDGYTQSCIQTNADAIASDLTDELINLVDKIILDNLTRYIISRETNHFLHLIQNYLLTQDINIRPSYSQDILTVIHNYGFGQYIQDVDDYKDRIIKLLHTVINMVFNFDKDGINSTLCNMFNELFPFLNNIKCLEYRYEIDRFERPILLYTTLG